jgi:pimeloyl-ACP methyl ester carboxylesterase
MSSYLLVHGAWGGGWVWDDLAHRLEKAGHRVTVVDQLPSAGTEPASLGDLTADANHVRGVLNTVDEPVVLVGHSYGGMVITELADHPKVRHSVYLAAFWPRRGQSLLDVLGEGPMPNWIVPRDDGALEITDDFELARDSLCADLDRDRAREMFSRVVLQSAAAFGVPSTAPDRGHPTTYMIASQESDNSIPVAAQEAMSANANEVVRLPAAHMVQLSRPDELAEALGRI